MGPLLTLVLVLIALPSYARTCGEAQALSTSEAVMTGLGLLGKFGDAAGAELEASQGHETERLIPMLRGLPSTTDFSGVRIAVPFPNILEDPEAVVYVPETRSLTFDFNRIPEWARPHFTRITDYIRRRPGDSGRFMDLLGMSKAAFMDPQGPTMQAMPELFAAIEGYHGWTNRKYVEKSRSNVGPNLPRHLFRNPSGTAAVSHALRDGKLDTREVLVSLPSPSGDGRRLVGLLQRVHPSGKIVLEETTTCMQCHFLSANSGAILTRKPPETKEIQGRVDYLKPIPDGMEVPSWPEPR